MATEVAPCPACGRPFVANHPCLAAGEKLVGSTLAGRYRIDSVIGLGGMGTVYAATDLTSQQPVAIKTLHAVLSGNYILSERFRREATVASKLKHPNIITIHEFGRAPDGTCYIAMELLEGRNLRELVREDGPLSLRRTVHVIEQIAAAVSHAHAAGVVHRDIKPHNIMIHQVDGVDHVKVLDFGLVKALEERDSDQLTLTGNVMGTPQYMSPEQTLGETVDARSDLYSVVGVLYYCLTGSSPFNAKTVQRAKRAAFTQALTPIIMLRVGAPVPSTFDDILEKGLSEDKDQRFQTAVELVAALRAAIAGLPDAELDERPTTSRVLEEEAEAEESSEAEGTQEKRPPALRTALVVVLAGAALLAGLAGSYFLHPHGPPAQQEDTHPAQDTVLVRITSEPSGAKVEEDGRVIGATPLEVLLPKAGTHSLTFRAEGYQAEMRELDLSRLNQSETSMHIPLEHTPTN